MNQLVVFFAIALLCGAEKESRVMEVSAPDGSLLVVQADALGRDESGNIVGSGKSVLRHGSVEISCAGRVTIFVSHGKFRELMAKGTVTATAGDKKFWGSELFYDEPRRLLTVGGNPRAQEGRTIYTAGKNILCYTETGVMQFKPTAQIVIDKRLDIEKPSRKSKRFLGLF